MAKHLRFSIVTLLQMIRYIWAFPSTLLGMCFLALALASGGSVRRIRGVLEVHGGVVSRLLQRGTPWIKSISALTLGHVVLGVNQESLDQTRTHERIHVAQYEKWGPLFIPLYFLFGIVAYCKGQNPYLDNRFEKEAFYRQ